MGFEDWPETTATTRACCWEEPPSQDGEASLSGTSLSLTPTSLMATSTAANSVPHSSGKKVPNLPILYDLESPGESCVCDEDEIRAACEWVPGFLRDDRSGAIRRTPEFDFETQSASHPPVIANTSDEPNPTHTYSNSRFPEPNGVVSPMRLREPGKRGPTPVYPDLCPGLLRNTIKINNLKIHPAFAFKYPLSVRAAPLTAER
jgi:hypothetical protein